MGGGDITGTVIWLVFFMGVMYLLIFLPQKKREKKTRAMLEALTVGDEIVTIGGIAGKIVNIKDDQLTIETGAEKTRLDIKKWSVKETKEVYTA